MRSLYQLGLEVATKMDTQECGLTMASSMMYRQAIG